MVIRMDIVEKMSDEELRKAFPMFDSVEEIKEFIDFLKSKIEKYDKDKEQIAELKRYREH